MPAKPNLIPRDGHLRGGLLFFIRFLLLAAVAIAGYLLWVSMGGSPAGCGPESDCHRVLNSRWAYWFGLPVSLFALMVYGTLFAGTLSLPRSIPAAQTNRAWRVLFPAAILVCGAAAWFILLQLVVIRAICPFCMTAHACALISAILLLCSVPIRHAPPKAEKQVFLSPNLSAKLAGGALLGLALLISGQSLHSRKSYLVKTLAAKPVLVDQKTDPARKSPPTNSTLATIPNSSPAAGQSTSPPPQTPAPPKRLFQVHDGAFQFDLEQTPLIGSPAAPHLMVSLFDYTCHHCRDLHPHLLEAQKKFSSQLAIISLPMPLDGDCNPAIKRTPRAHQNACQYARLGLSIWRANRSAHTAFEEFLFAPNSPPPLDQARAFAEKLVGKDALDKSSRDPWVDEQLNKSIALYAANYAKLKSGSMPELIIGNKITFGALNGLTELYSLLSQNLGLTL